LELFVTNTQILSKPMQYTVLILTKMLKLKEAFSSPHSKDFNFLVIIIIWAYPYGSCFSLQILSPGEEPGPVGFSLQSLTQYPISECQHSSPIKFHTFELPDYPNTLNSKLSTPNYPSFRLQTSDFRTSGLSDFPTF